MSAKLKIVPDVELAGPRPVSLDAIFGHDPLTRTTDFPGSTQIRASTDIELAKQYADLMQDGVVFPPILLIEPAPGSFLLADGHHRYEARCILHALDPQKWPAVIMAEVQPGDFADAIRVAIEANRVQHGKSLNKADLAHAYLRAAQLDVLPAHDAAATQALLGCSARYARDLTEFAREKYRAERDALIVALWQDGRTQAAIATEVGVSVGTVNAILKDIQKRQSAEIDKPAAAKPAKGASINQAAAAWAKQVAEARRSAALEIKPPDRPGEPIEGVYPLPEPPPEPFERPRADDMSLFTLSELLDRMDKLPEVDALLAVEGEVEPDPELAAAVAARLDRSVAWLAAFHAQWQPGD